MTVKEAKSVNTFMFLQKYLYQWELCHKYVIQNMELFFCFNCKGWVKDKVNVLDQDWTLMDQDAFKRTNTNFKNEEI